MKTFLKLILIFLFAALTPLLVLSITFKSSDVSASSLKIQFTQNDIYKKLNDTLIGSIDKQVVEGKSDDPLTVVAPYIKKEITPAYIQKKTETLIDDTDAWLSGANPTQPVLSFNDLRDKIVSENANLVTQLKKLNEEYNKAKPELQKAIAEEAKNNPDITPMPNLPDIDINTFLNKNLTVPVGSFLVWLKPLVWLSRSGFIILVAIMSIIPLAIFVLSTDLASKLRWLSLTSLLSLLWNILPFIAVSGGSVTMSHWLSTSENLPPFVSPFVEMLIAPLFVLYLNVTKEMMLILGILTVVFLVVSFFVSKPAQSENPPITSRQKNVKRK